MNEKGSAIFTVIVAVLVLLLISGIFFYLVNHQARITSSEEKALKAFYMAESGVNYGAAYILDKVQPKDGSPSLTDLTQLNLTDKEIIFNDYGGKFKVSLVYEPERDSVSINSQGTYPISQQNPVTRNLYTTIFNLSKTIEFSFDIIEDSSKGKRAFVFFEDQVIDWDKDYLKDPPLITNKSVGEVFSLKVVIINHGGNDKEHLAEDVYFSFLDASTEDDVPIRASGTVTIVEENGIETVVPQGADGRFGPFDFDTVLNLKLSMPQQAYVRLKIEGEILKHNGHSMGTGVTISNAFFIGSPTQWEEEIPK